MKSLKQYITSISINDIDVINKEGLLDIYSKIVELDKEVKDDKDNNISKNNVSKITNIKSLNTLKRIVSYKRLNITKS